MTIRDEVFEAWAPPGAIWSPWAKPVLFSQMTNWDRDSLVESESPIELHWAVDASHTTAVVSDLPGALSVTAAMAFARIGYRPVPLYNACPDPYSTGVIDVRPIMKLLAQQAAAMQSIRLPADAPPAFLLDARRNRASRLPGPGDFDNRSISLPTDFPSAAFLLSRGIRRVLLIQPDRAPPQPDLSHTLMRWQEAGITFVAKGLIIDDVETPQPLTIRRPSGFRTLWHNLLSTLHLRPHPLGGFGGRLPMPSSG